MQVTLVRDISYNDTLSTTINSHVTSQLSETSGIFWHDVDKSSSKPCIGCFNCWIKTPGFCIMKDQTTALNRDFINSDLAVYVGPVLYGCYSPAIKRSLDHIIPIVLPYFREVNGEIHHKQRYPKRPSLIILAYNKAITPKEKETFISLTRANARNLDIPDPKVYLCQTEEEALSAITEIKAFINEAKGGPLL